MSTNEQRDAGPAAEPPPTSVLVELSNTMVGLHKQLFGRGPTRARSHWVGPDAVACFLEETLTPAERNLVRLGEHQRLRDTRLFFQYASIHEFCEPVERITGRRVRSFHSSIDTMVDGLTVELFLFYADRQDGPSRSDMADRDEL